MEDRTPPQGRSDALPPRLAGYRDTTRKRTMERWTTRQAVLDLMADHAAELGDDDYADALKVAAGLHRDARP